TALISAGPTVVRSGVLPPPVATGGGRAVIPSVGVPGCRGETRVVSPAGFDPAGEPETTATTGRQCDGEQAQHDQHRRTIHRRPGGGEALAAVVAAPDRAERDGVNDVLLLTGGAVDHDAAGHRVGSWGPGQAAT